MSFSIEDLGLAYRKAKVDLYYSSHSSPLAIADYESQLADKFLSLLAQLNGADEEWVKADIFLGDWFLAPKSIEQPNDKQTNGLVFASPIAKWQHVCNHATSKDLTNKPKAEFRLMAQCSLDFHVLSALWMIKVGQQYDKLLSDCAYGNRLRRGQDGNVNPLSFGSFKPYLKPFRDWRDGGIEAMRSHLEQGKSVVALTADVSSFYHELNPSFMLDDAFNQLFDIKLSDEEKKLHRLFITALQTWAKKTPLGKGLPVGLPASAVVANMALIELDRLIERQVVPLYYGRYVDDILLVMENGANFRSTDELWTWLFKRSDGKLGWTEDNEQKKIRYRPNYLEDSQICFANDKNKAFLLEGETGQTLVDSISHQIHLRASEWRAMPNLPSSARYVGTDLVAATQSDGEIADNLRKTDTLTMRRAGFAIKLRDFEAYERDLPPASWKEHRHAFFSAFIQHVLVLPNFFELAVYLPRVVRLATACEDFVHLRKIIEALENVYVSVDEHCKLDIKSCPEEQLPNPGEMLSSWHCQLFFSVYESILAAFPPRLSKEGRVAWVKAMESTWYAPIPSLIFHPHWAADIKSIQMAHAWLFSYDLAHMPFRFIGLPKEMVSQRGIPPKRHTRMLNGSEHLLPENITQGISILASWLKFNNGLPHGLLFSTRPFNLAELFVLAKDPFAANSLPKIQSVVMALRGFNVNEKMPQLDKNNVLQIPVGKTRMQQIIAVSSWKTEYNSWAASVARMPDPDLARYARLNRLINSVISQPKGAHYFVLPELALPAHWFLRTALKLQGRGISIIAGIEYLHASKGRVRNQLWAALHHDGLGFRSTMIYRQDKQRPALHEEQELQRLGGREMKPDKTWTKPPILQHGDFRFGLLVCSELTNISYRATLRGQIDALFVPEWNQDTETFNSLVESAALDIHAYIIQCNDRQFGDSRIRAPNKDNWLRDVLRVKGGIDDYCVTGEIDIQALRQFQSSYRSPSAPFKPVPDGFEIAHDRKTLPRA